MGKEEKKPASSPATPADPKKDEAFTVDEATGATEMPSVTKLLNRKSLKLKKPKESNSSTPELVPEPSSPAPLAVEPQAPFEPQMPFSTPEPSGAPKESTKSSKPPETRSSIDITLTPEASGSFQLETSSNATMAPAAPLLNPDTPTEPSPANGPGTPAEPQKSDVSLPKIQRAAKKPHPPTQSLVIWDAKKLIAGKDPLGKGITVLLQKGARQALYLGMVQGTGSVPHFLATAAVNPQDKLGIWTGLKWDPTVVPEMWNFFVKAGLIELSPPGANTYQKSNRNVVRGALGITPEEWLLLVRIGPANACRGVVAFVSPGTLMTEIESALPLLFSLPPQTKK